MRCFDRSVRFLLGPAGAGEPLAAGGHRWEWLLHGRKRVHLLPPARAAYAMGEGRGVAKGAVSCVLEPGEVLSVPHGWALATEYLEPSIGFVTGFTHDRLMGGSRE